MSRLRSGDRVRVYDHVNIFDTQGREGEVLSYSDQHAIGVEVLLDATETRPPMVVRYGRDEVELVVKKKGRVFVLRRHEDETGVSGTGDAAEGIEFRDGKVAMRWIVGDVQSTAFYDSISDVEKIHGHGGKTVVHWGL